MAKKQTNYEIRMFLEDGTPLTKENVNMTGIKETVTTFQIKMIIRKLNQMSEIKGSKIFDRLVHK